MTLDIVCPVRIGDANDELRYSLRTIEANYPHGEIWIVGHKPPWLTGVNHIPGNHSPFQRGNIFDGILTASRHPDIPERFVIFNDDFFVTRPTTEIPVGYRSTLAEHLRVPKLRGNPTGWWAGSLRTTLACLQELGYPDPLSYELHIPFVVYKQLMAETLERFTHVTPQNPPQWRSLYGNINKIGGQPYPDCKLCYAGPIGIPFHSTDDASWRRHFAKKFQNLFPEPSRYER